MIIWEETSFSHSVPKRLHTRLLFPCNINFVQQALFCNLIYGDNEKGSKDIIWDILSNMGNNITILGSADFSPTIHTDHLDIPSREQSAFHIIELDSFNLSWTVAHIREHWLKTWWSTPYYLWLQSYACHSYIYCENLTHQLYTKSPSPFPSWSKGGILLRRCECFNGGSVVDIWGETSDLDESLLWFNRATWARRWEYFNEELKELAKHCWEKFGEFS